MTVSADQIERFLRDNPSGPLWVTVGFASAFGLAWLNERTRGRPVRLLIGDTRTGFANYSEDDRRAAIRFIQRPDVSVRNWYRKHGGHRTAHAKTWMVEPDQRAGIAGRILVGSANLTRRGLLHNVEMLTLADPSEHQRLRAEFHQVMDESWAIEDRLLGLLGVTKADPQGPETRSPQPRPGSGNPWGREFRRGELRRRVVMIACGLLLLFVLFTAIGRCGDAAGSPAASDSPTTAPSAHSADTQTVAPDNALPSPRTDVPDRVPPRSAAARGGRL